MGYRCVCTTGTVRRKTEVQSNSQKETFCSGMSSAPFAAVERQRQEMRCAPTAPESYELYSGGLTYHWAQPPPPSPLHSRGQTCIRREEGPPPASQWSLEEGRTGRRWL